jgi:NAD+ diphosphatase
MSGPPLARSGVDRAAHRRIDQRWLDEAFVRARVLLVDSSGRTLCSSERAEAELLFVPPEQVPDGERIFLGEDGAGTPYFAVVGDLPEATGARPASLRQVGAVLPDRDAGLFVAAAALAKWHATHRFSAVTGEPTRPASGGWVRVDASGTQLFPRIDPAIIVLVHDGAGGPGGRCLLGNNAAWPPRDGRRFFSTLAGFVEPGESAEAAVAREVHEEVGVAVSRLRYQGSQAWPFPGSLMLGFSARADPEQPLDLDLTEIADARWFSRGEIAGLLSDEPDPSGAPHGAAPAGAGVALPGPASIAQFLIRAWLTR